MDATHCNWDGASTKPMLVGRLGLLCACVRGPVSPLHRHVHAGRAADQHVSLRYTLRLAAWLRDVPDLACADLPHIVAKYSHLLTMRLSHELPAGHIIVARERCWNLTSTWKWSPRNANVSSTTEKQLSRPQQVYAVPWSNFLTSSTTPTGSLLGALTIAQASLAGNLVPLPHSRLPTLHTCIHMYTYKYL